MQYAGINCKQPVHCSISCHALVIQASVLTKIDGEASNQALWRDAIQHEETLIHGSVDGTIGCDTEQVVPALGCLCPHLNLQAPLRMHEPICQS